MLNNLISLLIGSAYWLLVRLSGILTWENWLLLSNIKGSTPTALQSRGPEEKTGLYWYLIILKWKCFPCLYAFFSLPSSSCLYVICHHLRSGRSVVLVPLTVLHESEMNLIGWMSCDAVSASVRLLHWHFVSVVCLLLLFSPCVCVHTCVWGSINSREVLKWRLCFMDERVGCFLVPNCPGIYQVIWAQTRKEGGRKQEMKKPLQPGRLPPIQARTYTLP